MSLALLLAYTALFFAVVLVGAPAWLVIAGGAIGFALSIAVLAAEPKGGRNV